jgi:hypothetical protein
MHERRLYALLAVSLTGLLLVLLGTREEARLPAHSPRPRCENTASSPIIVDGELGWETRCEIANAQVQRQVRTMDASGRVFFQNNWEPTVSCAYERRVGKAGDGGKWVCDPHRLEGKAAVVYSIGSNNEFSFETAMHDLLGPAVEIHIFDPGPPQGAPAYVTYHQFAWDAEHTLGGVMATLGHAHVHVLKLDVEGYEHHLLMAARNALAEVDQILIEVHVFATLWDRLRAQEVHEIFAMLERLGFEIFHKEANTLGTSGDACEFSLVRVTW